MDESIVEDALRAFITKEIRRALGEEYLDVYSPPHDANTAQLLRYIGDKWLGIFADSHTVANKRHFFAEALRTIRKHPTDVAMHERILAEIGNPGKAAALTNPTPKRNGNGNGNGKSIGVDADGYGGTRNRINHPTPTSSTPRTPSSSVSTISKTSAHKNNNNTPNVQYTHNVPTSVDADGDMTMGGDEGTTNLSSSTISYSASSSSARQAFPPPLNYTNGNGDVSSNGNININNNDSAMVDVGIDTGNSGRAFDDVVVVLDGANIGWRYGTTKFSMIGVASSAAHYQRIPYVSRVIVVLPDSLSTAAKNNSSNSAEDIEAVNWINSLKDSHSSGLILTPDSDYDDAYVTHLGRQMSAIIVSPNPAFDIKRGAAVVAALLGPMYYGIQ